MASYTDEENALWHSKCAAWHAERAVFYSRGLVTPSTSAQRPNVIIQVVTPPPAPPLPTAPADSEELPTAPAESREAAIQRHKEEAERNYARALAVEQGNQEAIADARSKSSRSFTNEEWVLYFRQRAARSAARAEALAAELPGGDTTYQ